ncbi:hypothetical protein PFICI_14918 [Pestalotiopsis fici W106-1]|uniref:Uncharacterized protein n=1 Tax=Pestalotiopsis fici (strain W106-1 / CGMCC3.15140) TaxID=1229662 RepID=W3WHF6_PESFW|nr:uncharacterized protein PFICI_14918 [Pestalotiopsis fici W106-1]ETS73313.1 hypothetical protein PFICI_14918 [Pestalotiopsis fici W106-1]
MEAAAKSIKSLISVLPDRPHQLSIVPDSRYQLQPNDTRLEEDAIRPLQYMTYLFDIDRGLLLTRAYSDIRDEESYAPKPSKPPQDSTKPKTKVSLQDYKKKKQENNSAADSNTPTPRSSAPKPVDKERVPVVKKEESPSVDSMLKQTTLKKPHPSLPPKPDVRRPGAEPSPERKKRPTDVNEERSIKRTKLEGTPNGVPRVPSKSEAYSRTADKANLNDKKSSKELKPSPMPATNGRSAISNASTRGPSPRPSSQANGSSQKSATSKDSTPRKEKSGLGSKELKSMPMLSPIGPELGSMIPGYDSSPRNRPGEKDKEAKSQSRRARDEPDRSSTPKKSKYELPPLLSPTLPPVVREAQASAEKDKRLNGLSSQLADVASAKKAPAKLDRDDVDGKDAKEEERTRIVKLKYPKRIAKTISRLLALAPKKKHDTSRRELLEPPRKDDRTGRERSESAEPPSTATARKRPRTATDAGDHPSAAIKRPRTSDVVQPSTPSKHSIAMQRVASSSSQAGTPGTTNNLTPAAPVPDRRSASVDPERTGKLRDKHALLSSLGTKLKHQRDRIIKPNGIISSNPTQCDRHALMATDLQSLVAYMAAFQAMDELRDIERKIRDPSLWRSLMPLIRVYRGDCGHSNQLTALITRLHCITLLWQSRSLVALGPDNAKNAREMYQVTKDQDQMWKQAMEARKRLDDAHGGDDGGVVAKLIDQLGPWSTSEDVVSITIKILRKTVRLDDEKFVPLRELIQACEPLTNGP